MGERCPSCTSDACDDEGGWDCVARQQYMRMTGRTTPPTPVEHWQAKYRKVIAQRDAAESERDALRALLLEHAAAHEEARAARCAEIETMESEDAKQLDRDDAEARTDNATARTGEADRALVAWTREHLS